MLKKLTLTVLILIVTHPLTFAATPEDIEDFIAPDWANGALVDSNYSPLTGVRMTLSSSSETRIVTSDSNGVFRFRSISCSVPADPNFTLTPFLANYTFDPSSVTITVHPCGPTHQQSFSGTLGSLTTSPLDTSEFFVRQQYVDLLRREPDEDGLNFWSNPLRACTTAACRHAERRNVQCAFIDSQEYQTRFQGVSVTVCQ